MGKLKKDIVLTEFSRTISVLLGAGIDFGFFANCIGHIGDIVLDTSKTSSCFVEKGIGLSESVSRLDMFPPILSQMIAVEKKLES